MEIIGFLTLAATASFPWITDAKKFLVLFENENYPNYGLMIKGFASLSCVILYAFLYQESRLIASMPHWGWILSFFLLLVSVFILIHNNYRIQVKHNILKWPLVLNAINYVLILNFIIILYCKLIFVQNYYELRGVIIDEGSNMKIENVNILLAGDEGRDIELLSDKSGEFLTYVLKSEICKYKSLDIQKKGYSHYEEDINFCNNLTLNDLIIIKLRSLDEK